ncbi:CCA-adding enzyme [Candidatus Rhabdochlamydia oedothoracis]|uniref:CCA-adding enzyme n=1 Tax=Candidatus Rhabdochlamydia oedothoracis TaxID=2720720 RepID=A0ABX8UZ74_9BACT|nr:MULTISPECIES: CCA tRNA nucleotidyltransferase [Rhabdochlamydia]KAG6558600.1 CCA-adding enzyme [Candidatus Rhabdochlamydia sp. W815]QYF48161.1 CCA-adding enzyme [Candidatus Rhabdochlamydia oedothoracis]
MRNFALAKQIVQTLVKAGFTTYFAGGWVRDYLMNHPSDDIDIATQAPVDVIQRLFPKTIPVGLTFGIVIVVVEGHQFEVATFRKEKDYVDGRRPTHIESATPEQDALRRDFTINGLFWDPLTKTLYDYVEGQKDLRSGIIRAIGDPHARFLEDRLRMIRAVRYSTRFNFSIEVETYQAILTHAKSLFPSVAIERVWQEFHKMAQFGKLDTSFLELYRLGLLTTIFPEFQGLNIQELEKKVEPFKRFSKKTPVIAYVLELFPDRSLEELLSICEYLKLSRIEKNFTLFFHHAKKLLSMPKDWLDKLELVEWAHFYADPQSYVCLQIFGNGLPSKDRNEFFDFHQKKQHLLKKAIERIQKKQPLVTSSSLKAAGIVPGKQMGLLLQEAENISINQEIEDPQEIISQLKKMPIWNHS